MVTQQYCTGCGAEKPTAPPRAAVAPGAEPVNDPFSPFDYCAWTTEGRGCMLLATTWFQPYGTRDTKGVNCRPGYCHWHAMCTSSPGLAHDLGRFRAFVEDLHAHNICTQFSHHPADYVYRATRGIIEPNKIDLAPCEAPTCWVPETLAARDRKLQYAREQAELVPPEESAKNLLNVMKKLTEQMTFPDSHAD